MRLKGGVVDRMAVSGGSALNGKVKTSGAKNSALKLLFATILAEGTHQFKNIPELKDIESTSQLLESLGISSERKGEDFLVHSKRLINFQASYDLVRKMRASILCLGPMLAKYGEAIVSLPGGCAIGSRPIDLHLDGMRALGVEIELKEGFVHAKVNTKTKRLQGTTFLFETITVGGTENMMMAAALAEGVTILENAAKEPEIVDLADYLVKMGAKISGQGTSVIKIEGVNKLSPASHIVMPDRIEAGTLLIAGAITGGEVTVEKCIPSHLDALLFKLKEAGFRISHTDTTMTVERAKSWEAVDITTSPYPHFPTDLQAQFMSLMTVAQGTSIISETVFENRFMHIQELMRLGADITPKTRVAVIRGNPKGLTGAPVMATDLRASACLILAGLIAKGETVVNRIYHLDRGYEKMEDKLTSLGAKIKRII